jgi:hypothetical protein
METVSPNIVAVIVMALIYMGIGWYWYSPKAFGNMLVAHYKQDEKKNVQLAYVCEFILAVVMGYVLATFIIDMNVNTIGSGLKVGFLAWLGFIATSMVSKVLWAGKPLMNLYINSGFYLVILLLYGAVFSVWR